MTLLQDMKAELKAAIFAPTANEQKRDAISSALGKIAELEAEPRVIEWCAEKYAATIRFPDGVEASMVRNQMVGFYRSQHTTISLELAAFYELVIARGWFKDEDEASEAVHAQLEEIREREAET